MSVFAIKRDAVREFRNNIYQIAFDEVLDNEDFITELITEDQLFEQGIRGDELFIADFAPYSPVTIAIKQVKGQPTNRVTLRDEGDFHKSFYIKVGTDHFEVKASDSKTEELVKQFGSEIMEFTDENLGEVIWSYVYPKLIEELRIALTKR